MSHFPLHQLLGDPPPLALLPARRHTLQDEHPSPIQTRLVRKPPPPQRRRDRKLMLHKNGAPNANARVLGALMAGERLSSVEIRRRLALPKEYVGRALNALIRRNLVSREGSRRQFIFFLTTTQATQVHAALADAPTT